MADWTYSALETLGGRFQIVVTRLAKHAVTVDVTSVRGAPTQLTSFSEADPFGDSTATFTFPTITPFDDLSASDLGAWLAYYANVDIYWVPSLDYTSGYGKLETPVINPLTNQPDIITPANLRDANGRRGPDHRIKVFEGFIASMDFSADESHASLDVQCQGALFQLDRYLQKPFFPFNPWPLESLIADAFDHSRRPHLRTAPLKIQWPAGWGLKIPKYTGKNIYTPVGKAGSKFTGYSSRATGSWDHALTGFVQDQLTVMLTDERSKVTPGNQWTIQQQHASATSPGRAPVLLVRDRFRQPDFSLWVGTPGVSISLTGDSTQSENIIYGDGTSVDGTVWRNAVVADDGSRTDYLPLAAARDVYPPASNPAFSPAAFASEAYTKYGTGFDQTAAASAAAQALARDRQPGWTGTITLSSDPSATLPRWLIRAGMTVLLKGFAGSGDTGIPFHISAKTANPMEGTVELTVDTRYRDLLTVEEAQSRTRDPLTPVKMLQVNRASVMIQDIQAPWDYSAGSGYVPKGAKEFFNYKPNSTGFPYASWIRNHPPLHFPRYYVKCNSGANTSKGRWAGPVAILASEKDTIARTEFVAVDVYGRILKVPFHVSIYYVNVHAGDMPYRGSNYSPFQNNAFEKVDPATGTVTPNTLWPQNSFIVGWGNRQDNQYNRAGFYPGREADGAGPTGLFVDDSNWDFDMTTWHQYFQGANPPGKKPQASDITLYAMFYCEHPGAVYFLGRLIRQSPGANS